MTCLTPTERALIEARLAEAEKAYHALMMGGGIRVIKDQNGESVEYTSANSVRLMTYINTLRAQLGLPPAGACKPTQPMRFVF